MYCHHKHLFNDARSWEEEEAGLFIIFFTSAFLYFFFSDRDYFIKKKSSFTENTESALLVLPEKRTPLMQSWYFWPLNLLSKNKFKR